MWCTNVADTRNGGGGFIKVPRKEAGRVEKLAKAGMIALRAKRKKSCLALCGKLDPARSAAPFWRGALPGMRAGPTAPDAAEGQAASAVGWRRRGPRAWRMAVVPVAMAWTTSGARAPRLSLLGRWPRERIRAARLRCCRA